MEELLVQVLLILINIVIKTKNILVTQSFLIIDKKHLKVHIMIQNKVQMKNPILE